MSRTKELNKNVLIYKQITLDYTLGTITYKRIKQVSRMRLNREDRCNTGAVPPL